MTNEFKYANQNNDCKEGHNKSINANMQTRTMNATTGMTITRGIKNNTTGITVGIKNAKTRKTKTTIRATTGTTKTRSCDITNEKYNKVV
jgi:hypothetical protein